MPVTINGSSGITANDGSVFTNASGNVGIGTSSPAMPVHVIKNWTSGKATVGAQPVTSFASGGIAGFGCFDSDGSRALYLYSNADEAAVINGKNTRLTLWTNETERMRIAATGQVTTPFQPRAYVEWGSSSVTGGSTLTFSGGSVNVNVGSIYNGSNGRFTAPVNGVYRLTMGSQGKQAAQNDSGSLYYALNGSGLQGQSLFYGPAFNGNHSDYLFSLNANDYIQVQSFGNNNNSYTLNGVRATFELVG